MFTDKEDLLELAKAGYQITVINNAKTVYIGCKFGGGSRKKKETTVDKTETVEVEVEAVEEVSDTSPLRRDESPAIETVKSNPKVEEAYNKLLTMDEELTVNLEIFNKSFLSDEKNEKLLDKILSTDVIDEVDDILFNWINDVINQI